MVLSEEQRSILFFEHALLRKGNLLQVLSLALDRVGYRRHHLWAGLRAGVDDETVFGALPGRLGALPSAVEDLPAAFLPFCRDQRI